MPHASIFYFTGTGNTRRAVEKIRWSLESAGWTVDVDLIRTQTRLTSEKKADLFIFAFCVYSFAPPPAVKRFFRRMSRRNGDKAAVFAVHGGGPYQAADQAARMLGRRGFAVVWTGGAAYPDNWTQFIEPSPEETQRAMLERGDEVCEEFVRDILVGVERFDHAGLAGTILGWLTAGLFGILGRRMLGKFYIADSMCNACGLCARTCPVGAIVMKGRSGKSGTGYRMRRSTGNRRPRWKLNCECCNRCINICPEKAIQVSAARMTFHLAVNIAGLVGVILGAVQIGWAAARYFAPLPWGGLAAAGTIAAAVVLGLFLMLIVELDVLDPLLNWLQRLPGLRRMFEASWTRGFRRYIEPGFKPEKE